MSKHDIIEKHDIVLCKLISGEELVGKCVRLTESTTGTPGVNQTVTLSDACVVVVESVDPKTGALSVNLIPYCVTDPDGEISMLYSAMTALPKKATDAIMKLFIRSTSNIVI